MIAEDTSIIEVRRDVRLRSLVCFHHYRTDIWSEHGDWNLNMKCRSACTCSIKSDEVNAAPQARLSLDTCVTCTRQPRQPAGSNWSTTCRLELQGTRLLGKYLVDSLSSVEVAIWFASWQGKIPLYHPTSLKTLRSTLTTMATKRTPKESSAEKDAASVHEGSSDIRPAVPTWVLTQCHASHISN